MTLTWVDPPAEAAEPQGLFHSSLGLFGFQADHMARAYWQLAQSDEPVALVLWDTGVGKTVMSLATACLLFEDGLIDQCVVVAEKNKCLDWAEDDVPGFTDLTVAAYRGTPERRRRILADPPQVLVMSWETGRNDICSFKPKSRAVAGPGPLAEFLLGKRTLFVFDEHVRMRSRRTNLYIAWDYLLNRVLRKDPGTQAKALALTGGLVERDPIDHWNACKVLAPWRAGSVAWMEETYVASWDLHQNPWSFKNLTADDCEEGVTPLNRLFGPITLRKSKFDPDVIDHFPAMVENRPTFVRLEGRQRDLYDQVEQILAESEEGDSAVTLMRQIAADPESLLLSKGRMAREIVSSLGAEYLLSCGSAKRDRLCSWAERMGGQQMVVFTFFGQSVLPLLERDLRAAGLAVSVNHGQMGERERKDSQDAFKSGDTQVFLSSDAGARGLNLGVGTALLHYEMPSLYSVYVQRSNRIHRIGSRHASVTVDALVAADTVEAGLAGLMVKRHGYDEKVKDDDYTEDTDPGVGYLSADERRRLLRRAERMAA